MTPDLRGYVIVYPKANQRIRERASDDMIDAPSRLRHAEPTVPNHHAGLRIVLPDPSMPRQIVCVRINATLSSLAANIHSDCTERS